MTLSISMFSSFKCKSNQKEIPHASCSGVAFVQNARKQNYLMDYNWMYTYFIKAHDELISSRLKNYNWERFYNINIKWGNVSGLKIRWSRIPSTCCADVVPLPKEKLATVITKHVRPISVTLAMSKLAEQVSTKA